MTTDTYPKLATATVDLGGTPVTIAGIAKGAGMIAPDMATMLSYVFTDAPIAAPVLQALLSRGVERFVQRHHGRQRHLDLRHSDAVRDGRGRAAWRPDASTDAGRPAPLLASPRPSTACCSTLRIRSCKDGEGARKFVEVTVEGAESDAAAKRIALSIANSPLVKTAVAGEDANWGRVVMAVGKAGETADRDRLSIFFGPIRVAHEGLRDPAYSEAGDLRLHEGRQHPDPRRPRRSARPCHRLDLRSDQGLCRDQRRLSIVICQALRAALI